jgi:hypothetical protein
MWWSRTPDTLATLEMCPVVALAPAPRVPPYRGFARLRGYGFNGCVCVGGGGAVPE